MKAPTMFVAGVLLSGLALACSWSSRVLEASPLSSQPLKAIVVKAAGSPVRADWRVGAPIAFERLTVFPVISDQPTASVDFITLDQGLRSGKVIITELGANGQTRRINRRQISDGAEVNRLALTNNSGKALVLIAGEMILGGKQDRIVGHDCVIEAGNVPVPFDVFCVEHGRWSGDSIFGQGRGDGSGAGAGNGGGRGTGSGSGSGGGAGPAQDQGRIIAMTVAPMALPNIREKAQAKKSQGDVWNAVSETVMVTATSSETLTLNSVYQDKRVNTRINNYERAFKNKLSAGNIVGVVAAVGGKIVSADVFASHALFQAYWPKMLKSYALEAVSTIDPSKQQANRIDAEAFLARSQGTSDSDGKEGVYRIAENQSSADASFELQYTKKNPTLVHFNRVAKK
ncbi:MAG TPA: DUF6569 family protein [Blastocatellia bacterium]|nr:DUF6569 family protein [Blastocatellia bacterium]